MKLNKLITFLLVGTLAAMTATLHAQYGSGASESKQKSLYERLGGVHGIAAVVDNFINRIAKNETVLANKKVVEKIVQHGPAAIKFQVTAFMCKAAGGPQKYVGQSMLAAHKELGITEAEWETSGADFVAAMNELKVPMSEQQDVLKLFASLKKDIVNVDQSRDAKMMTAKSSPTSLYSRLGGLDAIAAVVDEFINQLAADPVIGSNPNTVKALTSGKVSGAGLKYLVTEQVCQAAGGPQKYSGRSMKDSHKDIGISEKEWEAGAAIFKRVLDKFNVPAKEQGELFAIIGSTKKDIVKK